MNFSEYCMLKESKFFKLDDNILTQLNNILDKFYINLKKDKIKNNQTIGKIHTINFNTNKEINISIIIKKDKVSTFKLYYEKSTGEIFINYYYINSESRDPKILSRDYLYMLLTHEITHAVQRYKKTSEEYKIASNELIQGKELSHPEHYYNEPMELEAQLTGMMYKIKKTFEASKIINLKLFSKNAWENDRERLLLALKSFIKSPYSEYKNGRKLPKFFEPFSSLLDSLYTDKNLWKKFKLKLMNLYTELEKEYLD